MRRFDPWIGSGYKSGIGGVRLLILGEAHYGADEEKYGGTHTRDIIRKLGQEGRYRFHSVVQRLVAGGRGWISATDRAEFWEKVAFYNFIQSFPGPTSRVRPTAEMWLAARQPFLQTLQELAPQLVLVLGHQLSSNLPPAPDGIAVCHVQHPSSRGFRYAKWQPIVQSAFEGVRSKQAERTSEA